MDLETGLTLVGIAIGIWSVYLVKRPIARAVKRILGVGISEGAKMGDTFGATVRRPPFYKRWLLR